MDDYFLCERNRLRRFLDLNKGRNRFKGVKRTKINILLIIILALAAGLFFSSCFDHFAQAEKLPANNRGNQEIADPLEKIKNIQGQSLYNPQNNKVCLNQSSKVPRPKTERQQPSRDESKYMNLVSGYPMAAMVPYISKRDPKTASFLVAIAKKESDWGVHSPSKDNRDCFNYWGYKGGYNLTDSGYSCFDSPEQAVQVVGDRIDQLVRQNIDTPQKMLVWKCGGNCVGDTGAASWVATVSGFFYKLVS